MSRSGWVFVVAIVGLIVAVIFMVFKWGPLELENYPGASPTVHAFQTPECNYPEAESAYSKAQQTADDPTRAKFPGVRSSDLKKAEAAKNKKDAAKGCEERSRNQWDLAAQWHSSIASKNVARISENQRLWGIATFLSAILAALFALLAAWQTKRQADIAQDTHIVENRAWLSVAARVDNSTYTGLCVRRPGPDGNVFQMPIIMIAENRGRLPAKCTIDAVAIPRDQDPSSCLNAEFIKACRASQTFMVLTGSDPVDSSRKKLLNIPEQLLHEINRTSAQNPNMPALRESVVVVQANYFADSVETIGMTAKQYVFTIEGGPVVPGWAMVSRIADGEEYFNWKMSEFPTLIHAS